MAGSRAKSEYAANIRNGDADAFSAFFHEVYADAVLYAEKNLRDRDLAQDIVQDVFVDIWNRRDRIDPQKSLRGYVFKLTSSRIVDHFRHMKVRRAHADELRPKDRVEQPRQDPFLASEIRKTIDALPEKQRTVFRMNRFAGLTYAETAEFLGVSQKTVEKHMSRALGTLRVSLKRFLIVLFVLLGLGFTAIRSEGRQIVPEERTTAATRLLSMRVDLDARDQPLRTVLQQLSARTGAGIVFDDRMVVGRMVTADCRQCVLADALNQILVSHDLGYEVLGDRVIALVEDERPKGAISGRVVDAETGAPLPLAQIRVGRTGDAADDAGEFSVSGLEGRTQVDVRFIGYEPVTFTVDVNGRHDVGTIELTTADIMVGEVMVYADPVIPVGRDGGGARVVADRTISRIPTIGTDDPLAALQMLPGIDDTEERSGELFIRGGTPRTNLVLWDGIPIFNADHFFGMISTFSSQAVDRVRMYERGAPASFGGRIGTVVEMESPPAAGGPHIAADTSPLVSGLSLKLPSHRQVGAWVSARRSMPVIEQSNEYSALFDDMIGTPTEAGRPGFSFRDVSARMDLRPGSDHLVSFSFHHGDDALNRRDEQVFRQYEFVNIPEPDDDDDDPDDDSEDDAEDDAEDAEDELEDAIEDAEDDAEDATEDAMEDAAGKDDDLTSVIVRLSEREHMDNDWGITGFALNWHANWSNLTPMHVRLVRARTNNSFALAYTELQDDSLLASRSEFQRNTLVQDAVRLNQTVDHRFGRLTAGPFAEYTRSDRRIRNTQDAAVGVDTLWASELLVTGAHATQRLGGQTLRGDVGLRVTHVATGSRWYLSPRLALRYRPFDRITLQGSWGRYHQFLLRSVDAELAGLQRDEWRLLGRKDAAARSNQSSVALAFETGRLGLSADVWHRTSTGVPVLPDRDATTDNDAFSGDRTRAHGLEVSVQGRLSRFLALFTWGWSDIEANAGRYQSAGWFDALYERKHSIKGMLSVRTGGLTTGIRFSWASGRPLGALVTPTRFIAADGSELRGSAASNLEGRRLPSYSRVDIQLKWSHTIGLVHFSSTVALINVLNRENVRYQRLLTDTSTVHFRNVGMLGFTPVARIEIGMTGGPQR